MDHPLDASLYEVIANIVSSRIEVMDAHALLDKGQPL
jgi:hypothetical protein